MEIEKIIKVRREELKITLEDVARVVGVSAATVSRWESGEIKNLRRDKIAKLAEALECTPAYLMGWSDENGKPIWTTVEKVGKDGRISTFSKSQGVFCADEINSNLKGAPQVLPDSFKRLNVLINTFGYNIVMTQGNYFFIGTNGTNEISVDRLEKLSESIAEYTKFLCTQIDAEFLQATIK